MNAYLVIATWPDGTEGLLFPRPGNVRIASTPEQGHADFETAKEHLSLYANSTKRLMTGTTLRLVPFVQNQQPLAEFKL